jgi:hypothetical protein
MQKLILALIAGTALGALWRFEKEEDGAAVALSPFFLAFAIEVGIFLLRRQQNDLLTDD